MPGKLIMVSGASHTGTTLIGAILANDPLGFATGEVYFIYRYFRRHNTLPPEATNSIWQQVKTSGRKEFFSNLLQNFNIVTDSSKQLKWLSAQQSTFPVQHVLLFKDPLNAYYSFWTRNFSFENFYHIYKRYYKAYKKIVPNYIALRFEYFLANPSKITKKLCEKLDIPYFKGKVKFWKRDLNHIAGAKKVRQVMRGERQPRIFKEITFNPNFNIEEAKKLIEDKKWNFLP